MSGLRITRVCITDVGVLRGRVELGAFDPGITLITGGNETGKTTAVNALRCAFFERHGTTNATVRKLRPHGDVDAAPEIEVEFEIGGHRFELRKRFLKKAESVLRVDGGTPLTGAAADEKVWELLGSSAPRGSGAKREDMGLWGVLWVSQDEAAFSDPSVGLGEETRGALQDAIGRQVGQIAGGRHGELLRARVHEEAKRFWTAHGKPGGELKAALDALAAASERVQTIRAAIHEVEDQADRHANLSARLDVIDLQRPKLEAELRDTERAVDAVQRLRRGFDEAQRKLDSCELRLGIAAERLQKRQELVERVAAGAASIDGESEVLVEMERTLEARVQARKATAGVVAEREREAEGARQAQRRAERALQGALEAREAAKAGEALKRASDLIEGIVDLNGQCAAALDDAAFARLRELAQQERRHRIGLEGEGSRFVVEAADLRVAFGRARTVALGGVGEVTLAPGRPGLGAARDRFREARQAFAQALEHHGIPSLAAARSRRSERIEVEAALATLSRELDDRSPDGAETLAELVAADGAALQRDRETLELAEAAAGKLRELRATLAGLAVDEDTLQRLEGLERTAAVARARQEATGTGLKLRATKDLDVALDDGPAEAVAESESLTWTLTHPTRITLAGVAVLDVAPGGEDVQEAGANRRAADEALARALAGVGVADMDGARRVGRVWADSCAAIAATEESLQEKAPAGLEDLRGSLRSREADLQHRTEELEAVRGLQRKCRQLEADLEANPVTAEVLDELTRLEGDLAAAQDDVHHVAASLRVAEGAEQWIMEKTVGTFDDGSGWEFVPGEGGADLDAALERTRQELDAALRRRDLADMACAEESWKAGLGLAEKLAGMKAQLADIAPEGIETLQVAAAAATEAEADVDLDALRGAVATARDDADAAARILRDAREEDELAAKACNDFDREVVAKRMQVKILGDGLADHRARLESTRGEVGDDALARTQARARDDVEAARTAAQQAEQAVQGASPELLEDDTARARASLEENRSRQVDLREELSAVKALLDRAAAEGRFEDLGEALADQDEARRTAARLEHTAAGVKRLAEEVDRAYAAAQARFLAPVVEEARPYLGAIRPGTEIRMSPDLALDGVVRRGTEEDFSTLSGGTREQLSVIVRIALARVLARDAETDPLPLVLDDTMGWTDDARFLQMTRILRNASKQFQIIVLTCHPERFARLQPGRTIDLEKARRDAG